ncbi:chromatin accessibility complex protein 1-like isoform X1 [Orbicella faveolata]|uniref:chromatin accessibility complex protein 1-like isoform X1 n=1 Tax=Orbicella faveolata TaxID=48498 RepID=UPI0009E4135F|nr:chromatin accessibility complex protein 1-like isoform X1 [Orbicella faveolata]
MAEKASVDGGAGKLTQLPVARIKTIMKSSPDLPSFSQDSVFLITKATELFVDYLAVTAHKQESDSRQLTYKGLSKVVEDDEALQFLADIVPPKVLVKDFMESLKKSRKSSIEIRSSSSDSESE